MTLNQESGPWPLVACRLNNKCHGYFVESVAIRSLPNILYKRPESSVKIFWFSLIIHYSIVSMSHLKYFESFFTFKLPTTS